MEWAASGAVTRTHRYRRNVLSISRAAQPWRRGTYAAIVEPSYHGRRSISGECAIRAIRSVEHFVLRAAAEGRVDGESGTAALAGGSFHGNVRKVHRRVGGGGDRVRHPVCVLRVHRAVAGNEQR